MKIDAEMHESVTKYSIHIAPLTDSNITACKFETYTLRARSWLE